MPLTAYVLIAIYESGLDVDNGTRSDLVQCLLSPSKRTKIDPYALALKAYALVLAEYPGAEEVVQELLRMATDLGLILFWKLEEAVGSHHARTVETAGYALLAMVALNPKKYAGEAKKIVQFVDTVVALQALALYEQVFYEGSLDVVVTVTATAEDFAHAFKVTEANKLLQQRETLRVFPTSVSYTVEGRGCVVIQTVLRYNVPEAIPSNAFSLRINATNNAKKCALKHMEICSAYLLPDGASNMVGIEIRFVSGFAPPRDELERVVRENGEVLKRYEFKGNRLTFYASEFVTGKEFCVDFDVVREVEVKDAKPGIVNVYDYYEPEVAVNKEFEFPPTEGC
ncbi:alpha2-macroglobulin-like [Penaeus vannamei]|uniref:Alpha2-macroglobulin-like n=1 Tax=Penaeus vannamei TaxID=6689 RepID=A0A423TSX3_PENVA|nr:alpha2-macroglobulin-like [Penaeus vannamei]